jgi:hypothetical protein
MCPPSNSQLTAAKPNLVAAMLLQDLGVLCGKDIISPLTIIIARKQEKDQGSS